MKTRLTRFVAHTTIVVAVSSLTFWLGFREGAEVGLMLDSGPRGGISLFHLQSMEKGATRNMTTSLESDVDLALIWAHRLEGYPLLPAIEPLWGISTQNRGSLERLANYRKGHPSPMRYEALAAEPWPDTAEAKALRTVTLNGARENDRIIASMVEKYASK